MSGAHTDAFRLVWSQAWELKPGGRLTSGAIVRALEGQFSSWSVGRALRQLARAGILVKGEAEGRAHAITWVRVKTPDVLTVEWLTRRGGSERAALNVLKGLETAGYLVRTRRGWERSP